MLIGKHVVDFLLVLIELLSLAWIDRQTLFSSLVCAGIPCSVEKVCHGNARMKCKQNSQCLGGRSNGSSRQASRKARVSSLAGGHYKQQTSLDAHCQCIGLHNCTLTGLVMTFDLWPWKPRSNSHSYDEYLWHIADYVTDWVSWFLVLVAVVDYLDSYRTRIVRFAVMPVITLWCCILLLYHLDSAISFIHFTCKNHDP